MNRSVTIGDLTVHQLGFGAMRLTGHGPTSWGEPADRGAAIAVLREAVELGVDFIDTADAYGPAVSENLIKAALHPYHGITIATKGGLTRDAERRAIPDGSPGHLKRANEASLRRLGVDQIDLYQLHMVDPKVAFEASFGALLELQDEGKIKHIGLSNIGPAHVRRALSMGRFVSVQHNYSVLNRDNEELLQLCRAEGIAFIPYFPIGGSKRGLTALTLDAIAARHGATVRQIGLAWLLQRYDKMLPIPGTGSIDHLGENMRAADVALEPADVDTLTGLAGG